jgi:hypothetical protein
MWRISSSWKRKLSLSNKLLKLDFSDSLFDRIFHTRKFAKQFENSITPSAIRFCQMDWDVSVDDTLAKLGILIFK